MLNMASVIHVRDFESSKFTHGKRSKYGVKNVSHQSGPWIDVFAIIPTDLGKSLQFF